MSAIAAIVPPTVVAIDTFSDMADACLLPEEEAALGKVVDVRRREFVNGRSLARHALMRLGMPAGPILRGADREPRWPAGIVGSITHCKGYCAAVAARATSVATIGIDAEIHDKLPDGVLRLVSREEERDWIGTRRGDDVHWDRVLFSAKESVFKAWFPIARRWLGFSDASVVFNPEAGTFTARFVTECLTINGRETSGFEGRYLVHGGYTFTAVAVEALPSVSSTSAGV